MGIKRLITTFMISVLYIAAGGALGAVSRWGVMLGVSSLMRAPFPYGTLVVNVLGSLLMGVLVAYFLKNAALSNELKMMLTVGFLGSFTTFSTFSMDAMNLFSRGDVIGAVSYVFASVILSIGAIILGTYLVWKVGV